MNSRLSKFRSVHTYVIEHRKDGICLQMHGQVSRQPKHCRSAMLDPKGRAFCYVSGSLYPGRFILVESVEEMHPVVF